MALIINVECRACNRECGDYKHLLDETVIDDESTTLAALFRYCTTLECFGENFESGMPEHICNSCVEHLIQSYVFKKMVLKNNRVYRERLQTKAAEKQVKEENTVIEEEQIVEHEIGSSTMEENVENMEEFVSETEEVIENNNIKTEIEFEEWLETEKDYAGKKDVDSTCPNYVENEEDCTKILVKNEAGEESGKYILNNLNDNVEGVELEGFNTSNQFEEKNGNCEIKVVEYNPTEKDVTNLLRRKSLSTDSLTEADLTCQYCGKVFNKMYRLQEHSFVHTGEKPFACEICGNRLRTKNFYYAHMRTHSDNKRIHGNDGPYACKWCNKTYRNSNGLRVHELIHQNIRPFVCEFCDKTFTTKGQQKIHSRIHTGERPFICSICGKAYRESYSLKIHIITHYDAKPYQCEVCGKGMSQKSHYKSHMRIHTNEYPYKCDICERGFRWTNLMAAHRQKCYKTFNNTP